MIVLSPIRTLTSHLCSVWSYSTHVPATPFISGRFCRPMISTRVPTHVVLLILAGTATAGATATISKPQGKRHNAGDTDLAVLCSVAQPWFSSASLAFFRHLAEAMAAPAAACLMSCSCSRNPESVNQLLLNNANNKYRVG